MNSILLGGDGWVSYETVGGGQGGRPVVGGAEPLPGMSGVHTAMTNTLNTPVEATERALGCLLYTSDAADERSSVDLGGRRIIKKKNKRQYGGSWVHN